MKLTKWFTLTALTLTLTLGSAGCSLLEDLEKNISDLSTTESDDTNKYNEYVALYNTTVNVLSDLLDDYVKKNFDEEGNFKEGVLGVNVSLLRDIERVIESSEKALNNKPKMDIDKQVKAMLPHFKEVIETITEINEYYDDKTYLMDNYEKGKALHEQLIEKVDALSPTEDEFITKMKEFMSETENETRKHFEENGSVIRLALIDVLDAGEDLINTVYSSVSEEGVFQISDTDFEQKKEILFEKIEAVEKYEKDDAALKNEDFQNYTISDFLRPAKNFKSSSNELLAAIREGNQEEIYNLMGSLENVYENTVKEYNDAIK